MKIVRLVFLITAMCAFVSVASAMDLNPLVGDYKIQNCTGSYGVFGITTGQGVQVRVQTSQEDPSHPGLVMTYDLQRAGQSTFATLAAFKQVDGMPVKFSDSQSQPLECHSWVAVSTSKGESEIDLQVDSKDGSCVFPKKTRTLSSVVVKDPNTLVYSYVWGDPQSANSLSCTMNRTRP